MRRVDGWDGLACASFRRPAVAVGVFDGVHRGHRHVLEQLRALADEVGGEAVVVTFDTHPRAVLAGAAPMPLVSLAHRLVLLERLGVDATVVLPFDARTRDLPWEGFVADVLVRGMGARGLLFGFDTCFGRGGLGTYDAVRPFAERLGLVVRRAPSIAVHGQPVSATRIRDAVARGDLEAAGELLGRPPALYGTVVHGDGRGRAIGFPTANVDPTGEWLPPPGVYQVVVALRGRRWAAVANLGVRPTVEDGATRPTLEVHVPGVDFDFYGEAVEVEFVRRLRDERRFPTLQALVEQIRRDVASLGASGSLP